MELLQKVSLLVVSLPKSRIVKHTCTAVAMVGLFGGSIPTIAGTWDYYPTLTSAEFMQDKTVKLSWSSESNQAGVIVERKNVDETLFSQDTTLMSLTDSFAEVIAPEYSTSYWYRIRLVRNSGNSLDTSWYSDANTVSTSAMPTLNTPEIKWGWNKVKEENELWLKDSANIEDGYIVSIVDKDGVVKFETDTTFERTDFNIRVNTISLHNLTPNAWYTAHVRAYKDSDTVETTLSLFNISPKLLYENDTILKPQNRLGAATVKRIGTGGRPLFVGLVGDTLMVLPSGSTDSLAYIYTVTTPENIKSSGRGVVKIPGDLQSVFQTQNRKCVQYGNLFAGSGAYQNSIYLFADTTMKLHSTFDSTANNFFHWEDSILGSPEKDMTTLVSSYISDGVQADTVVPISIADFSGIDIAAGKGEYTLYTGLSYPFEEQPLYSDTACLIDWRANSLEPRIRVIKNAIVGYISWYSYRMGTYYGGDRLRLIDITDNRFHEANEHIQSWGYDKYTIKGKEEIQRWDSAGYCLDFSANIDQYISKYRKIAGKTIDVSGLDTSFHEILLDTVKNVMYLVTSDSVVSWSMASSIVPVDSRMRSSKVEQMTISRSGSGSFAITLPRQGYAEIQIFTLAGRIVKTLETSLSRTDIDLSSLSAGQYLMVVRQGMNTYTAKVPNM